MGNPSQTGPSAMHTLAIRSRTLSPVSRRGPLRTKITKPPPRSVPYSLSKASRSKAPSLAYTEHCAILGCRKVSPHHHTAEDVEDVTGWHPIPAGSPEKNLSPLNEARLQQYLDRKLPHSRDGYEPSGYCNTKTNINTQQSYGNSTRDSQENASTTERRFTLPNARNATNTVPNQNHDRRPYSPSNSPVPCSPAFLLPTVTTQPLYWPCAAHLTCSIKSPHVHTPDEIISRLSSLQNPPRGTLTALAYPPSTTMTDPTTTPRKTATKTGEMPDMQWKPCSMLDSYGDSAKDLQRALASIAVADDDIETNTNTAETTHHPIPNPRPTSSSSSGTTPMSKGGSRGHADIRDFLDSPSTYLEKISRLDPLPHGSRYGYRFHGGGCEPPGVENGKSKSKSDTSSTGNNAEAPSLPTQNKNQNNNKTQNTTISTLKKTVDDNDNEEERTHTNEAIPTTVAAALEKLSLAGNSEKEIEEKEESRNEIRNWFERCGYFP